ncbi:MAG TPA: DUF1223 domain-containing protein [Hanamia sp.]|nr:DUF1223 domain-containing protein [Hanamia sp.]
MKKIIFYIALSIPVFTLWFCNSSSNAKDRVTAMKSSASNTKTKNTVVLELFTSQGCSSCPPADKLLCTYTSNKKVIALSFHVDYWDRLGWKDPFSAHNYSERQYKYASALKSGVYTPQLVINGETQLVGSEAGKITSVINKMLLQDPQAHLSLEKTAVNNDQINIRFRVSGNIANSLLNMAFIEKKVVTGVGAGENRGATLTEYNVVRGFTTVDSIKEGENTLALPIPSSLKPGNREFVLFLQQKNNNKITAAGKAEF